MIIRDLTIKQLKRGFVMTKRGWKPINEMHCTENTVTPIGNRNIRLNSQGPYNTQNMLMHPLYNRILLWSGNTTMLMYDTMSLEEISQLKLKTIFSFENLNRFVELSFDHEIK